MLRPSGRANTRCSVCGSDPGRCSFITQAGARNGFAEPRDRAPNSGLSRPQPAAETASLPFEPAKMPANCGLFGRDQERPVGIELRGGAGRTQTSNQTVMSWKDSNLNQAVMSEPLRLRKRVIFPPTGRKDSKYLPGMQFCRTSLRRGQVRGAEGREPLDEPK